MTFREMIPVAGLLGLLLLTGCGKPASVVRAVTDQEVAAETGPLPAAGTANRLSSEQSAFLRQHANDPVDWYPWGEEAFRRAKAENRMVLVSIGYASCPWSLRMQRETFSDPVMARFLNQRFVNVLVDREERPDVNNAFLHYVFWKQKQSGWPLHVWLTPDGLPYFSGVYFPKVSSGSSASWETTVAHVANAWAADAGYVGRQAKEVADRYLADCRKMWVGPDPAGNPEVRGVSDFLALAPAERAKRFRGLGDDELQAAAGYLPGGVMEDVLAELSPGEVDAVMERLRPVPAALLFGRVGKPEWKERAFRRFASQVRATAFEKMRSLHDPVNGGFSQQPKFMQPYNLEFLLRFGVTERAAGFGRAAASVEMAAMTLRKILDGGIHDQLAGGFHRYSTDAYWAVPQFEKMLYDQGVMAQVLTAAAQVTGDRVFAEAARSTVEYAVNELSHPGGAFYCAEGSSSAASSGEIQEGIYYLWDKSEADAVAGAEAVPLLKEMFGFDERGNLPIDSPMLERLPRANLLIRQRPLAEVAQRLGLGTAAVEEAWGVARGKLLEARRKRPRPMLEDKALTSWNGVMISGLARTGFHAGDEGMLGRAVKAAEFILTKMRRSDGGLVHAFLDGPSAVPGFAEDYAMFIAGLLDLYEATGDARWLKQADELQEVQIRELWDKAEAGFFDGPESSMIFQRIKSMDEATELAAGSVSAVNLARLRWMAGKVEHGERCRKIMERFAVQAGATPAAFMRFIQAAELLAEPAVHLVVAGRPEAEGRKALVDALRPWYRGLASLVYLDGSEASRLLVAGVPGMQSLPAQGSAAVLHVLRDGKLVGSAASAGEVAALLVPLLRVPPQ